MSNEMIRFGSQVKIDERFKNGFYAGCEGIVLHYDGNDKYLVELNVPMHGTYKKEIKIIVPLSYLITT